MDIDIDFQSNFNPIKLFKQAVPASMVKKEELGKHPCGIYFQNIAIDDITGLSAIPFEEAEVMGYFKIDFLHLSVLDELSSKQEMRRLLKQSPNWDLLLDPICVSKLSQIHNNYSLLEKIKPRSVEELADTIALIRPGKRYLVDNYLTNKEYVRNELYKQNNTGYSFKKSHAIAYALTIVLQLHKIQESL